MIELSTAPVAFSAVFSAALYSHVTHVAVHVIFRVSIPIARIILQLMPLKDSLLSHNGISRTSHSHLVSQVYCD